MWVSDSKSNILIGHKQSKKQEIWSQELFWGIMYDNISLLFRYFSAVFGPI